MYSETGEALLVTIHSQVPAAPLLCVQHQLRAETNTVRGSQGQQNRQEDHCLES